MHDEAKGKQTHQDHRQYANLPPSQPPEKRERRGSDKEPECHVEQSTEDYY